jgi:hypothetical protein
MLDALRTHQGVDTQVRDGAATEIDRSEILDSCEDFRAVIINCFASSQVDLF